MRQHTYHQRRGKNARTDRWYETRERILGPRGDRLTVSKALGLHLRTVEKYENGTAPPWYELALVGLAERWKTELL